MGEVDSGPGAWRLGDWTEVAGGVHRMVVEPAGVNIGLVIGADGALLIDTGSSPDQGAQIRAAVAGVTDKPLVAVVVTHSHYDHAFGLAAFGDVPTIGHRSLAESLTAEAAADDARRLGVDPAALVLPQRLIEIADVVDLGGSRVAEIVHLGIGHTAGDLVVTVTDPATEGFGGVIFAGDLIETAGAPSFGPDSSPDQWSWTVDRLHGLTRTTTVVVPGHGDPVGQEEVVRQRDTVDAVRMEIERLAGSGVSEADALEAGDWPIPAANVAGGIAPGYAEIAARNADDPGAAGGRPTLPLA